MDDVFLENDFLKIKVKHKGAELCSLFNKQTALEYVWPAGDEWAKHAPLLFPIVGQLKNDQYEYKAKMFTMERHGFARTKNFRLKSNTSQSLTFILESDAQTMLHYPFAFQLEVSYTLHQHLLAINYKVINPVSDELLFSIGAHPAFKIPLLKEEFYSDYYLQFNHPENADRWLLCAGLIAESTPYFTNRDQLPLSHSLFKDDALVFKNMQSTIISIRCKKTEHGLHFKMDGYPFLGIWAAKNANFVCIEPWHGIADGVNTSGMLENKEGIIKLSGHNEFNCAYSIETF